jgi:CheY-like chemotaxis protein/MinD-like ATPase involved in chromosome partitioning or flagellar assembly
MADRILIIDDDTDRAALTKIILNKAGFQCITAFDGKQGLIMAKSSHPNLILLDLMMPGMNGFDVCIELRKMPETIDTPVIFLTAKAETANKIKGLQVGADDYMTVPFESDELLLRVRALLRRAQASPQERLSSQAGKIIAVFNLRGGAGCTTLAVNLAIGLKQLWNEEVGLVDFSLPIGVANIYLNIRPHNSISELTDFYPDVIDKELIEKHLTFHESGGIYLLGGVFEPATAEKVTDNHVATILDRMREQFSYVLVDTPHDFSPQALSIFDKADEILIPIPPDIASLLLTKAALKIFDDLGYIEDKIRLVVNWTFKENGLSIEQIKEAFKNKIGSLIQFDKNVSEAISTGVPVILNKQSKTLVTSIEDLAWDLSRPSEQLSNPDEPTETWKYVSKRKKSILQRQSFWSKLLNRTQVN